ncbi:ATP-binding protein [Nocardia harenae]|uniref:ATP-binding protein n=1 Tax=Nocardia harenae TaxID=358707 RepID=UPI000832A6BE|nr:ATP-binding protein [Nocardia harenae]
MIDHPLPIAMPSEIDTFQLQRAPRKKSPLYLTADRGGPFVVMNQSLGAYDVAGSRLVLVETMSSVFHNSVWQQEGDSNKRIETAAVAEFLSQRINRLKSRTLPSDIAGEIFTSCDGLWQPIPVERNEGALLIGELTKRFVHCEPVPHVVVAISGGPGNTVTVEYWPARALSYSLESCVDSVLHALFTLGWMKQLQIIMTPRPVVLELASVSLDDAAHHTLRMARTLLIDSPADEAGRADSVRLIQQMLMDPWEEDRPSWLARTYRPSFDLMIEMRQGKPTAAALVAEHLVSRACDPVLADAESTDLHSTSHQFAMAITCFLHTHVAAHSMTNPRVTSRICNLIHEWINRERTRPYQPRYALDCRNLPPFALDRLDAIVRYAPWLEYYVERRPRGRFLTVRLSDDDVVKTLALIRPRNSVIRVSSRPGAYTSYRRKFIDVGPDMLTTHFELPEQLAKLAQNSPTLVNDLARVCEKLFISPSDARAATQVLDDVPGISVLIDRYAEVAEAERSGLGEITVLIDHPPGMASRPVLVNTSQSSRAVAEICGLTVELAEFTLDIERAAKFATSPLPIGAASAVDPALTLTVAGAVEQIPNEVRSSVARGTSCDKEMVDLELFRGRRDQLIRLSGTMRPDVTLRQPMAIFGPRRAGKTTLAVHACRRGVQNGALSGYCVIDMFSGPDGTRTEGYVERLAEVVARRVAAEIAVEIDTVRSDPIEVLRQLDAALEGSPPFGIVFDEFDILLVAEPESDLRRLVSRLGKLRWKNLVVIGTVQRFHRSAAELEAWEFVECREDLSWRDGLTYFCPPLTRCETSGGGHIDLNAPVVLPRLFQDQIFSRIGLRPYFWGRLRAQLENYFAADEGYAVVDQELIQHVLDNIVTADPFLMLPLQSSAGLSWEECRLKDLFTEDEKSVLSVFAHSRRHSIPLAEFADRESIFSLEDRGYLRREGKQTALAVPIFGEFLVAHAASFGSAS